MTKNKQKTPLAWPWKDSLKQHALVQITWNILHIISWSEITKEVVENPFTESPVDFHEVCQAIEILPARDPVWFLRFFGLLAGIVKPEEAALWMTQRGSHSVAHKHYRLLLCNFF